MRNELGYRAPESNCELDLVHTPIFPSAGCVMGVGDTDGGFEIGDCSAGNALLAASPIAMMTAESRATLEISCARSTLHRARVISLERDLYKSVSLIPSDQQLGRERRGAAGRERGQAGIIHLTCDEPDSYPVLVAQRREHFQRPSGVSLTLVSSVHGNQCQFNHRPVSDHHGLMHLVPQIRATPPLLEFFDDAVG